MRQPEEMCWFEVEGEDGHPRACHGIKHLMPEGSKEITEAEARRIAEAVRARELKVVQAGVTTAAAAGVNLQPLQDQITALAEAVVGHARTLDKHEVTVNAVSQSVSGFLEGQKKLAGG